MVPLESFAGKDLLSVYTEMQDKGVQKRKTLQAKLSSVNDVRPVIQPVAEKNSHPNAKGALGDDSEGEDDDDDEESEKGENANDAPVEVTEEPADDEKEGSEGNAADNKEEDLPVHNAFCDGCRVRSHSKCAVILADVGSIFSEWRGYQRKQVEVHGLHGLRPLRQMSFGWNSRPAPNAED